MKESDIEKITSLFQQHREELGFINSAQVREKTTYSEWEGDEVLGAAIVNHCVQKPQTTLYDIAVAVSHRRGGIGTSLVETVTEKSPHDVIVAKCPVDLTANEFYRSTGWEKVDVEDGKNRALNVWEYEVDDDE